MLFRVIKSSPEGIHGGDSHGTIDEACQEIWWFKGWNSIEELRGKIRDWGRVALPGAVFKTAGAAIIATGPDDRDPQPSDCPCCGSTNVDYWEFEVDEDEEVTQHGICLQPNCQAKWLDTYAMIKRTLLVDGKGKPPGTTSKESVRDQETPPAT